MVKIIDKRNSQKVKFEEIAIGGYYVEGDDLCQRISIRLGEYNSVNVKTGYPFYTNKDLLVIPIDSVTITLE